MADNQKIFPQRLPEGFHGPLKPFQRVRKTVNDASETDRPLQKESLRLNAWKRRRSDRQIQQTNRIMMSNPVRTSYENPEWVKSTYFYQQKTFQRKKEKDPNHYNIWGAQKTNERADFRRTVFPIFDKTPLRFDWPESLQKDKMASTSRNAFFSQAPVPNRLYLSKSHYENAKEVTPKIGSCIQRQNKQRSTIIKIGHDRMIDTNSVV